MVNPDYTFDQYIQYGGMPFLASIGFGTEFSKNYLQDIFHSVVLKDIVKRNNIRDVDLLERIIAYALANVGKSFSATSISKFFKSENRTVAPETILNLSLIHISPAAGEEPEFAGEGKAEKRSGKR